MLKDKFIFLKIIIIFSLGISILNCILYIDLMDLISWLVAIAYQIIILLLLREIKLKTKKNDNDSIEM
jgi:hypothetical protein